ncbi:MAG: alpha/beta hydrolase [Nodosilinea sp. LVE1205-7]|jgi:pimeloyl-ACP methyl ester carboxylesterase
MHILLIHGLARTSLSLLNLERSLQQLGHTTEQFSYFAFAETFDAIANRLRQQLQRLGHQGSYAVVAHSLGGC